MASGTFEGKNVHHPDIRALFTRESLLASDWYRQRLETKQARDIRLWLRHVAYLEAFAQRASHQDMAARLDIPVRLEAARAKLERVKGREYLESLRGTIGADPMGV
jgi:hypothetical protein